MVRAAFGLSGEQPEPAEPPIAAELSQPGQTVRRGLARTLADRAWAGSLFANPRPLGDTWSIGEIRQGIEQGRSVVAVLDPRLLPGHAAGDAEASGDQPILVIGVTPDGLIYSDPSFSSSLGYGLELSDAEFAAAWQAATPPLQALVISTRPQPPPRDDYFRGLPSRPLAIVAEPTRASLAPVIAGPVASDTDAKPSDLDSTTPWATVKAPDEDPSASTMDSPSTLPQSQAAVLTVDDNQQPPNVDGRRDEPDRSWLVLAGAAVVLGGLVGLRRRRARQP